MSDRWVNRYKIVHRDLLHEFILKTSLIGTGDRYKYERSMCIGLGLYRCLNRKEWLKWLHINKRKIILVLVRKSMINKDLWRIILLIKIERLWFQCWVCKALVSRNYNWGLKGRRPKSHFDLHPKKGFLVPSCLPQTLTYFKRCWSLPSPCFLGYSLVFLLKISSSLPEVLQSFWVENIFTGTRTEVKEDETPLWGLVLTLWLRLRWTYILHNPLFSSSRYL